MDIIDQIFYLILTILLIYGFYEIEFLPKLGRLNVRYYLLSIWLVSYFTKLIFF